MPSTWGVSWDVAWGVSWDIATTAPASFDVEEAVCEALLRDATLESTFGRPGWLWIDEAPPEEPLPVAVLTKVATTEEVQTFAAHGLVVNDDSFQVNVYAASRASCLSLSRAVARAVEAGTYLCQTGTIIDVERTWENTVQLDSDPGRDGRPVWARTTEYAAKVVET